MVPHHTARGQAHSQRSAKICGRDEMLGSPWDSQAPFLAFRSGAAVFRTRLLRRFNAGIWTKNTSVNCKVLCRCGVMFSKVEKMEEESILIILCRTDRICRKGICARCCTVSAGVCGGQFGLRIIPQGVFIGFVSLAE